MTDRAIVEVDLSIIRSNILKIKKYYSDKIMAIVKADAYGLGAIKIAKYIQKYVDYFGVATVEEGMILRKNKIKIPIVLLGYFDGNDIDYINKYNISVVYYSKDLYDKYKSLLSDNINKFVAIDTGMHRLGLDYKDIESTGKIIDSNDIAGVFSHYASSDYDYDFSMLQQKRFDKVISHLNMEKYIKSISNSDGIFLSKNYDMIRIGISLFGGGTYPYILELNNAVRINAKVAQIKTVNAGESIGYERKFFAENEIKIAIVTFGYADGLSQTFSNGGKVLIKGKICPIVGKICMDYFMVDITGLTDIHEGEEVTIFGDKLNYAYLRSTGVSEYEFFCGIGRRVKRIYKK